MAQAAIGCIFIDSSVAFAEILGENTDVMTKFKLDIARRSIPCYVSPSVVTECSRKLNFTETFFDNVFRTFAVGHFNACRQRQGQNTSAPISNSDYKIFEGIFSTLKKSLSPILQAPLRELEKKMVLEIEELLRKKVKIDINTFLNGFLGKAVSLAAYIRIQRVKFMVLEQGFFKKETTNPDAGTSAMLCLRVHASPRFPFHQDDADNISSAWLHKKNSGENTVFTTFDFRTILAHADEIFDLIGLYCADPLYAVHFL